MVESERWRQKGKCCIGQRVLNIFDTQIILDIKHDSFTVSPCHLLHADFKNKHFLSVTSRKSKYRDKNYWSFQLEKKIK